MISDGARKAGRISDVIRAVENVTDTYRLKIEGGRVFITFILPIVSEPCGCGGECGCKGGKDAA